MPYITKEQVALARRQRDLREAQVTLHYYRVKGETREAALWEREVKRRLTYCFSFAAQAHRAARARLPQNIFLPAVEI